MTTDVKAEIKEYISELGLHIRIFVNNLNKYDKPNRKNTELNRFIFDASRDVVQDRLAENQGSFPVENYLVFS